MRNFKDESFIAQYLSPRLIREFHLFALTDYEKQPFLEMDSVHNDEGYRRVRQLLSNQYQRTSQLPDINITGYERDGDRSLTLEYRQFRGRSRSGDAERVMQHCQRLWGYSVTLETINENGELVENLEVGG